MKVCEVAGCERPHSARGYCSMHWQRVKAWGHPGSAEPLRVHGDLLDRMADKFTVGDGCWEWTASRTTAGYGQLMVNGKPRPAHVLMYELMVGPVSEGLELDHLCRVRHCIRPDHVEPVTHHENVLRGSWAVATECKNGHPWTDDTTYIRPDKGTRQCRACARERDKRRF